jgi:hypothetical protein
MSEDPWELVMETNGPFEAEMLRGALEANQIPVFLSQEGAGRAFGLTMGTLGLVQILVPHSKAELARKILQDYESGIPPAMGSVEEPPVSSDPES